VILGGDPLCLFAAWEETNLLIPSDQEEDEGDEPEEGVDPFAGMNDRQKKLYELRQRLQQCRKANQSAVVQEKKRTKVGSSFGRKPPSLLI